MSIFHGLEESKIIEGGDVIDKGDSEESDHEVDGLKMFRAAKAPSSIKGVINYLTSRQMFAKSKDLVIMDGDYDIPHGSANARKGKSTAKNSQQDYGLAHLPGSQGRLAAHPNRESPAPVSVPIPLQNPNPDDSMLTQSVLETADTGQPAAVHQPTVKQSNLLASPQCSVTVLVASDAKRHLESNMHALEKILQDSGLQKDQWISQVGFDEELLCGGRGYVQEVFITILKDLEIKRRDSMMREIGKILSPFPGVVRTPRHFFQTPVFKSADSDNVWETYEHFVRDHVNTLDSFEYDNTRHSPIARSYEGVEEMSVHQEQESSKAENHVTVMTSNNNSAGMTGGGKRSEKAEGKRPERTERENPSDTSDDSNHADPRAGTSHGRPRHQIQFEIKTKVEKVESEAQPETLKIAGTFTFKVWPRSEKNPRSSNVKFLDVDFQGPDAGIQRHYNLRYATIHIRSHDSSCISTVRQPLDTPVFADEVREGKNNKNFAQTSKLAALQASVKNPFGVNFSYGRNNGTEVGMTSERMRFRMQIRKWNEGNRAKWTYFRSDEEFLGSLSLPTNRPQLPIVDFYHPGQKNEGTLPEKMSVKLASLWVTERVEISNRGTFNLFSIFSRKKVEPVPIYTNIVPCVVIDFQTVDETEAPSRWTLLQRNLVLPVDADTAIKQPGEEEIGQVVHGHVIPSAHRVSMEESVRELMRN